MIDYRITGINTRHNRKQFDCGEPVLNEYLQRYAKQNQRKGFSATHVMEDAQNSTTVIGYFSLTPGCIRQTSLPDEEMKGKPGYVEDLPAILLTRLAVDGRFKGQGLGAQLLTEALISCYQVLTIASFKAVVVDAKHDQAKAFYEKHGFIPTVDTKLKLYLPKNRLEAFTKPLL